MQHPQRNSRHERRHLSLTSIHKIPREAIEPFEGHRRASGHQAELASAHCLAGYGRFAGIGISGGNSPASLDGISSSRNARNARDFKDRLRRFGYSA